MGNQTLVPSQIQSVETYFLDLKNFVQFKSSLGSTTFMKTAKVSLIENLDDFLIGGYSLEQLNNASITVSGNIGATTLNTTSSNSASSNTTKYNQFQLLKQRILELRELQQQVVVKIFPKYDLSIRLDLYSKRVREIKNIIYSTYGLYTNCLPFSELVITDRAAFLFRQFVKYNLYDRLSTRPFLTHIEKKWIVFQLLCAVNEIHSLQIVHGDIKIENVLVNSFLWVSLADFASYKPVYLSKNHPSADFNYYFDISRRRTCYLAPERLDSSKDTRQVNQSSNYQNIVNSGFEHDAIYELMPPDPNDFKPSMDIFSLGCVIAELFLERPLFDFAHLLAYRDKKYDPNNELINEIRDKNILDMIFSMLSLEPYERKTANEYLLEQNEKSFPSYFVYLKNYIKDFISVRLTPDEIVIRLKNDLPFLLKSFRVSPNETNNSPSSIDDPSSLTKKENQQALINSIEYDPSATSVNTNNAFLILLSLLLSSVRKLKFSENKLIAIDLMKEFSKFLDDLVILDRILPYYISLVEEQQSPIVKAHVIYALNDCLSNIYNLDLQNINIFPEIVFVILEQLSKDESFLVRSAVAKTISNFAITSLRYLDTGFLIKRSLLNTNGSSGGGGGDNPNEQNIIETKSKLNNDKEKEIFGSYDKEFENYQNRVTEIVMHLITDISQISNSSNAVKETLIRSDISKLCTFFCRKKTAEFLLPHMITILNEKTDWSVRAAFFDALCPVLTCIGWESVEIVKSLLEQGLRDSEEFVIHRTLITLSKMVEIGLLDRQQICFFLSNHITALLCHPSLWIRHGAINFITVVCRQSNKIRTKKDLTLSVTGIGNEQNTTTSNSSSTNVKGNTILNNTLNTADILCSVAPLLNKFLDRKDLINYDREEILFSCLKKPIKRAVYDCISQDGRSDQLFLYLNQRSEIRCLTNQNYLPGYVDCSDPNVQNLFEKLCKLGFVEEDEDKLLQMKDFMEKTRISRLNSSFHTTDMSASNNSTASVLNPWNSNLKDNFILKDGFISIMKDKFQRCNSEYLNLRKGGIVVDQQRPESNNMDYNNQPLNRKDLYKLNQNSLFNPNMQNKIDENTVQTISNDTGLNAEWRLMFGRTASEANEPSPLSRNNMKHRNSIRSNQSDGSSASHRGGAGAVHNNSSLILNQNFVQTPYKNCTADVERYLDRCKLIYEDNKLKKSRVDRNKETINYSVSSNTFCLASSISKWKPKGYLVAHSSEHTKEITKLSRNYDSSYFSTCSTSESSVKIWSTDSLLDGKSGFFKSIFTYDKQTSMARGGSNSNQESATIRPCCTTFYDKHSLAILGEDFRFHVIDFNSNRTQYHLYTHEKLFKPNTCRPGSASVVSNQMSKSLPSNSFDKTLFYYLNKSYKSFNSFSKCTPKICYCNNNYPIEMIYLDDTCPTWPIAATNLYEYFRTSTVGSSTKGLFCYSTSIGDFSCIDLRTRTKAFEIKRDLRRGYITSMITDPWYTWIAMGTSYGNIEVFDFRFMLPVLNFEHRSKTSVVKLCNHPTSASKIIASYHGNNEISVWNMDVQASKSQKNISKSKSVSNDPEFVFWGVQSVPPLCNNKMSSSYISGMVGCSYGEEDGVNGLICASTDMRIRYIDLNENNKDSFLISTPFNYAPSSKSNESNIQNSPNSKTSNNTYEFANSIMNNNVTYETRQIEGTKVLLELDQFNTSQQFNLNNSNPTPKAALAHQTYFTHHQDAISDLIVCYNHFNKNPPLIVTSSRDGNLKIWK